MDFENSRRRRERALRGSEASLRGSLFAPAGNVREGSGSAIPPRSLQPVSVEPVLRSRTPRQFQQKANALAAKLGRFAVVFSVALDSQLRVKSISKRGREFTRGSPWTNRATWIAS